MKTDATELGFYWPEETTVSNPVGHQMTIRPYAVRPKKLEEHNDSRVGELFRHYGTDNGLMNEIELKTWVAGGTEECFRALGAFKQLLDQPSDGFCLSSLVSSLRTHGFNDQTIRFNFQRLFSEGFLSAELVNGNWVIQGS